MDHAAGSNWIEWLGTSYRVLLSADQSGKNLGIFESINQAGHGPPRHVHQAEDEAFYLQSGAAEFWMDGKTYTVELGKTIFVPRGVEHTFRILGKEPARMLTIMTPGGFEGFFAKMAADNLRVPEDMDKIVPIATRFHLSFTGPPLSGE
jgi:mannose-6-phosphate isomerase-like protein (cupin superfamily)